MHEVNFKRLALSDIELISHYLSQYNLSAVEKFIDSVDYKIDVLSQFPYAGHKRLDLTHHDVRFMTIEWHYLFLYRVKGNDVDILRIISSKQEFASLLFE